VPQRGRRIDVQIGVMDDVELPEKRDSVRQPMVDVRGDQIHQRDRRQEIEPGGHLEQSQQSEPRLRDREARSERDAGQSEIDEQGGGPEHEVRPRVSVSRKLRRAEDQLERPEREKSRTDQDGSVPGGHVGEVLEERIHANDSDQAHRRRFAPAERRDGAVSASISDSAARA